MSSEADAFSALITFAFTMASLFITAIVVITGTQDVENCNLTCNGSQPSFYVIPFLYKEHKEMVFSVSNPSSWPHGLTVGLFDPKEGGKGDFVTEGQKKYESLYTISETIRMVHHVSLSRGSVINIQCSASRSVYLLVHTRNVIEPIPEKNNLLKENYSTELYISDDSFEFDDKIVKKAFFKLKSRSFNVSITVNETSQYVISFANDSPFRILIYDFAVQWKSRSPLTAKPLSLCSLNHPNCSLAPPDDYKGDVVSLVVHMDCDYIKKSKTSTSFDMSKSDKLAYGLGFGIPGAIGIILSVLLFFVFCACICS